MQALALTAKLNLCTGDFHLTTTKKALVQTLLECGATHAFTLPGLGITWMLDEFYEVRDRFRVVLTRSEQIASVMAQTYGKLSGRPGVFMGQGPFASTTGAFVRPACTAR
jgi:acetolactate synthase-1/2/3 large subunit